MKKNILLCLMLCVAVFAHAQIATDTVSSNVFVIKDSRIDLLAKKKAEINKKAADAKRPTKGFRIQVLNTTDRTQALAAKSKLLAQYPDHKTYLLYQAPYFKLRIGNFVERNEADDLKKELAKMFPTGVFVIPSDIEYKAPPEKEEIIK
ncbi:SPOR domain-containing protein [Lacibacter luteus]|uniref:SPOR domain-containing protein n=1 Tax=Lacibacter luteus TaxID=2508719 RepID=A0A4Q1CD40_9BACT|nr:SPOR domain-containing protein [Lacibacter luteus]RXK57498.1 SPOR domain-containing protein [Lacibacter luteus]